MLHVVFHLWQYRLVITYLSRYCREPRGFGFVKFRNAEDAAEAKHHLNHTVIGGREIAIVFAEENRKTPQEMRVTSRIRCGFIYASRHPSLLFSFSVLCVCVCVVSMFFVSSCSGRSGGSYRRRSLSGSPRRRYRCQFHLHLMSFTPIKWKSLCILATRLYHCSFELLLNFWINSSS